MGFVLAVALPSFANWVQTVDYSCTFWEPHSTFHWFTAHKICLNKVGDILNGWQNSPRSLVFETAVWLVQTRYTQWVLGLKAEIPLLQLKSIELVTNCLSCYEPCLLHLFRSLTASVTVTPCSAYVDQTYHERQFIIQILYLLSLGRFDKVF